MSEIEVRMALVGPAGRSLKFLNNKNNLANLYLHKQMTQFEREKTFNISHFEQEKLEAREFLRQVHKRDPEQQAARQWLDREEMSPDIEVIKPKVKPRQTKKKRFTATAPAIVEDSKRNERPKSSSGGVYRSKTEPNIRLEIPDTGRKSSMYLHLPATGSHSHNDGDGGGMRMKKLPKPNPKTLLDVMIGLNAFSHVPPPRCKSSEDVRSESRQSAESVDDGQPENTAASFMMHWKNTVAARRQSIVQKLSDAQSRSESRAHGYRPVSTLESVPEDRDLI